MTNQERLALLMEEEPKAPEKARHLAAILDAAIKYLCPEKMPPPPEPLSPCPHRGALLERCPCGDPMRDVWECRLPTMAINGEPGKATGRLCAGCKHAGEQSMKNLG